MVGEDVVLNFLNYYPKIELQEGDDPSWNSPNGMGLVDQV